MIRVKWDEGANQERWGTKAIRGLLVGLVLLAQEENQDRRVELVILGRKDHRGLQDQRVFQGISECQGPTVHLDQRVRRDPEGPKVLPGLKERRAMKDRSAHLATPAQLEDLEGKATWGNPVPMVWRGRKGTSETWERWDHKAR